MVAPNRNDGRNCDCYDRMFNIFDPDCPRCHGSGTTLHNPIAGNRGEEPTISHINRHEVRSYEIDTELGQTPRITMEMIDGSRVIGLLMDTDERIFHVIVSQITTEQRELREIGNPYFFTGGQVVLDANQFDGETLEVGDDVRFEGVPIGRVLGVTTDGNFTAEINAPAEINTPTVLRGTSDIYRIYYKEFGKEEQKYGGIKYIGYDHWLDFLEGIREHKNKGHKIVTLHSNKSSITEDKEKRLLKLF